MSEVAEAEEVVNVRQKIVTEAEVDRALAFLRDSATAIGFARSEVERTSNMLKHRKALAALSFDGVPVSKAELQALASDDYLAAIDEHATAAGEYEKLRSLRNAAEIKIEVWRTQSSNFRAMKL